VEVLTLRSFSPKASQYVQDEIQDIKFLNIIMPILYTACGVGGFGGSRTKGGIIGIGCFAMHKIIEARAKQKKRDFVKAYLRNVEKNLENLCESMTEVYNSTEVFARLNDQDDRVFIRQEIRKNIEELSTMMDLCDKAIVGLINNEMESS